MASAAPARLNVLNYGTRSGTSIFTMRRPVGRVVLRFVLTGLGNIGVRRRIAKHQVEAGARTEKDFREHNWEVKRLHAASGDCDKGKGGRACY